MTPESVAQIGIVINQVTTMRPATPHFTAEKRFAEPTPRIADVIAWVVLIGKCVKVAVIITDAAEASAAKPLIGSILKIFVPIVLMIFQPPMDVPSAIAVAAAILTHSCTSISDWKPAVTKAKVMIPIAFCASFVPCVNDWNAAVIICIVRKPLFTECGLLLPKIHFKIVMTI